MRTLYFRIIRRLVWALFVSFGITPSVTIGQSFFVGSKVIENSQNPSMKNARIAAMDFSGRYIGKVNDIYYELAIYKKLDDTYEGFDIFITDKKSYIKSKVKGSVTNNILTYDRLGAMERKIIGGSANGSDLIGKDAGDVITCSRILINLRPYEEQGKTILSGNSTANCSNYGTFTSNIYLEKVPQDLTFINPTITTKWNVGEGVYISWEQSFPTGTVTLELMKGSYIVAKIIANTPKKSVYWKVADSLKTRDDYQIKLSTIRKDGSNTEFAAYSNFFAIMGQTTISSSDACTDIVPATPSTVRKGVTIITHGFNATGNVGGIGTFKEYAKTIRKRLHGSSLKDGMGATIYSNNNETGKWEKLNITPSEGGNGSGDLNEEIILVFDWGMYSNKPFPPLIWQSIKSGYLESASDNLFGLLVDATSDDGKLDNKNLIETKPVHIIAHSRGTVMALQLLHRIGQYFPNIKIEQFTTLDPHPATSFGDVVFDAKGTLSSLPGLTDKIVLDCDYTLGCKNGNEIQLKIPENVLYVDNYYRKDGAYEGTINFSLANLLGNSPANYPLATFVGSFDGVSIEGSAMNENLLESKIAEYSSNIGGSHSGLHLWYFGTAYIQKDISPKIGQNWYGKNGASLKEQCRYKSGYYYSRIGGATQNEMELLKPNKTVSIKEMNEQLALRPYSNSLNKIKLGILNGNFEYGNDSGWWGNKGGISESKIYKSNNDYRLMLSALLPSASHTYLYFPKKEATINYNKNDFEVANFVVFDVFLQDYSKGNLEVIFTNKLGATVKTVSIGALQTKQYAVPIPNELKGKRGTFKFFFRGENSIYIDNCDFKTIAPATSITVNGVNDMPIMITSTLAIFPNPTSSRFDIDWAKIEGTPQKLWVSDIVGNPIVNQYIDNKNLPNINLSNYNGGVYTVNVVTDKGLYTGKILLNK